MSSSPVLPPELERIIFEMAALLRPTTIPNLMRTAWRVKNWVEPLLYRTVFIQRILSTNYRIDGFPRLTVQGLHQQASIKPPGFYQSPVKHLYLDCDPWFDAVEEVEYLLKVCGSVEALALVGNPRLELTALSADLLPYLRRLKVHFVSFRGGWGVQFTHPSIRNLTHLELLDVDWHLHTETLFAGLTLMPHLTHFAFNTLPYTFASTLRAMCDGLRANTRLSHVVLLSWNPDELRAAEILAKDIRFMCIKQVDYRADWVRGADSGHKFWELAEDFLVARLLGRVQRSIYIISSVDYSWRI
ncbi:hypothetical protein C8F04DRAFT_1260036 [Mycena alexandri]|uniref:Uncharacterized protein n=1 Tax=Mycena alexandri TaxID=1745969 RepID=A0AAD6SV67_9AGAR|nr:hypothetical protein C8F04DRAFT_1260036 [Mycena alexandri]